MSWTERLRKKGLTEEEFTACMAEATAERLTGATVKVAGPLKIHVFLGADWAAMCTLGGLWQETRRDADLRARRCEAYLRSLEESAHRHEARGPSAQHAGEQQAGKQQAGGQPGREAVLPTVQSEAFVRHANRRYEQAGISERLCARPFAGDLFVVYVLDTPTSLTFMTDRHREKLGIGTEEMTGVALSNLPEALPTIELSARIDERPEGPLVCEAACGGTYETSLLLVPALCEQMAEHVSGRMVAGVPARGRFLFAGSEDAQGCERLAAETETLYDRSRYSASKRLLALEAGRWTPYEGVS